MTRAPSTPRYSDWPTLIALSALAYSTATALREHLGHTLSLILLGGSATEIGAFYVNYGDGGLTPLTTRLVSLAGPVVSLLTGIVSFFVLRLISPAKPAYYFVWLLGTIGFMTATGYLLFSGFLGVGDFGTERGAVFYGASPEWLWRTLMVLVGGVSYYLSVRFAVCKIAPHIGGTGRARITYARHLTPASYLTGAAVSVAISLLNPLGLEIILTSAAAATLGGTSGFLWMMQLINPDEQATGTLLTFGRSWRWIILSVAVTALYAFFLGPTIHP